ncbi:cytochrome C oxidase subunit I [Azospirillum sp. TSO22-1]|nr:cytochrome C oxidase subunit I [Azospirillum sp. TSO22-1]
MVPAIRRIDVADLKDVLKRGLDDFGAYRTDVIFLCLIYPAVGLVLARAAYGRDMMHLLFPLASGFALIGPLAAVGLYEMSRRREEGVRITWRDAFGVLNAPSFGGVLALGLVLMGIFLLWLLTAQAIYDATLGPGAPASFGALLHDAFTTRAGWALIVVGVGVGFLFAVVALSISVVSFPLLLDRRVGADTAIWTSVRAVLANPVPMAAWGAIVTAGLVIGSIPLFVGLAVVMPVLGHATWHLYRRVVRPPAG